MIKDIIYEKKMIWYDRLMHLSHPRFLKNNLEQVNILLNNEYPLPFIFSTIPELSTIVKKII